jgi:diguanylate cyclase (GGDEF)-like protein
MTAKILILDNIKEDVTFFANLLTEKGYQVISTDDDFKLLGLIEHHDPTPDLILINVLINHTDTSLICKKIKLLEKGKNIPIIFVNRNPDNLDREIVFTSGGADYISYPFLEIEILTKIENQLQIKNLEAKVKEQANKLQKIIPHYQKLQKTLEKTKADIGKFSNLDLITKLSNSHRFYQVLNQEWLRCSRQRVSSCTNISLIIAKINDFEQYKQHYQQDLASNCLKLVADTIKQIVKRPADLIAFYEEEKFAILLPNTDQNGAERVAEIIIDKLKELQIPHNYSSISDYVSLSMGVATGIPTQALPANILIDVAEKALEEALKQERKEAIFVDSF